MKLRCRSVAEEPQVDMTPMIDMVFQLLIFFMLTFRVVAQEGDLGIRMPLGGVAGPSEDRLPTWRLRLLADEHGELAGRRLNDQPFPDWQSLQRHIIRQLGDDRGPDSLQATVEVEIDSDYGLHYRHVVDGISAVSGFVDRDTDAIVRLVERIRFARPRTSR